MSDKSETLEELERRVTEAHVYLGIDQAREEMTQLESRAASPDLWDNPDEARNVTGRLANLRDDSDRWEKVRRELDDTSTLELLAREEEDESLDEEIGAAISSLEHQLDDIELFALFNGEHDENDAVCEVHSGAGGTDACDWAEMVLRMYLRWAENKGFSVEIQEATDGGEAGISSATFIVKGRFAFGFLQAERGVHRLVRISPFDAQARRHTAFCSLSVVPFFDEVSDEVVIDEKDLRIDTYRSSGAGGQHVNKTESAVRITHIPTNIVVFCQAERSQLKNRNTAMKLLKAKLYDHEMRQKLAEKDKAESAKMEASFGSQIRNYVLAPYRLAKDLRTGFETGNVDAVLDGDIQPFIDAYLLNQKPDH